MLELACKSAVFHFNKKHLTDPTVPMWIIKASGKSYYLNHVTSNMPWSTKETIDNPHTKGSIKFKDVYMVIDDDNCATLSPVTPGILARVRAIMKKYTRILIPSSYQKTVQSYLKDNEIKHTTFKTVHGGCGSSFSICDIMNENDVIQMKLSIHNDALRILMPNEPMYKVYDDPELLANFDADYYDYDGDPDEFEDEDE